MPIHHAVLGLLADGSSYGYELKSSFEQAIGPQWGELNIGHLYQVLDRLDRDGFVTKKAFPQTDRPDRLIYRLTPRGRQELHRWLGERATRPSGHRDDFFLKLFVASRAGEAALMEVAQAQRESSLQELASLGKLRRSRRDDPLVRLLLDAAILHTKANIRVVELATETAAELTEAARAKVAGSAGRPETDGQDRASAARGA
jgi:DNA-binding PadR family transcriptional regulator